METVETTFADQWFAALDQRRIGAGARSWVAQVLGVHCEDDGLWIQLSSSEDPFATIVLHLAPTTPIDDVIAALERHRYDGRPAIIDVVAWKTPRLTQNPGAVRLMQPQQAH